MAISLYRSIFLSACFLFLLGKTTKAEVDPMSYGAKCDGSTDDTDAFQRAIEAAFTSAGNGYALLIPATGRSCVVSQLNLTNINNRIHIQGQTSISGFQSTIQCNESTSNSAVCVDFTGSQYITVQHVEIIGGTSLANAPRVTVLLAKSTGNRQVNGNSQVIHWDDVTVQGFGDFQVYNFGGELWNCDYCTFYQDGSGGTDLVRLSSANTLKITSRFATIAPAPISMTKVNLWATWSAGGSADAVDIDTSSSAVSSITIGGFGNLTRAPSFIRDTGGGDIHGLTLRDLRVEPSCTKCGLLSLDNVVWDVVIDNTEWAAAKAPTVPLVNFQNQVAGADIWLQPGDGQLQFPSTAVIRCGPSAAQVGVTIHNHVAYGGWPQSNDCPGAMEVYGNGIRLSSMTFKPSQFSRLPPCTSAIEGTIEAITDSKNATYAALAAGGGSNHVLVYCNGSDWIVH